jgi:hypothetical protein
MFKFPVMPMRRRHANVPAGSHSACPSSALPRPTPHTLDHGTATHLRRCQWLIAGHGSLCSVSQNTRTDVLVAIDFGAERIGSNLHSAWPLVSALLASRTTACLSTAWRVFWARNRTNHTSSFGALPGLPLSGATTWPPQDVKVETSRSISHDIHRVPNRQFKERSPTSLATSRSMTWPSRIGNSFLR